MSLKVSLGILFGVFTTTTNNHPYPGNDKNHGDQQVGKIGKIEKIQGMAHECQADNHEN